MSNKIDQIKLHIAKKINQIQSDYAKLVSLLPPNFKVDSLDVLTTEKIKVLEEIYKEIQKIEKE